MTRSVDFLPEGWQEVRVDDVIEHFQNGYGFPASQYAKSGMPIVTMANINLDGRFDFDFHKARFWDESDSEKLSRYHLQESDLIIAMTDVTPAKNLIGRMAMINLPGPFLLNQRVGLLITKPEAVSKKFLAYYSNFFYWRKYSKAASTAGVQANFSTKDIRRGKIFLPPLPEQREIAEILSTWDEAIAKTEQLITAIQARKKGLMQRLLTGEVRFPGFDGKWQEFRLEQIASKNRYSFTGGPFGSNLKAESYTTTGVRINQLQNIGDGEFLDEHKIFTSEEKANELISCNIFPGDIILSKMGDPVARATIVPRDEKRYLMASDGIRVEVDKECFDTNFVLETINGFEFRKNAIRHSVGSTRQRISLGDLRKLPIMIPSLSEQRRISSVLTLCNVEVDTHMQKLEFLKQQKKGLMQCLLTGQVRVSV